MVKRTRLIILSLFLISVCHIHAQREDFQTRLGLEVSGQINKDFDWDASVQQRWDFNSSRYDRTILQGGVAYGVLPYLDLGLGYRASFVADLDKNLSVKQRIGVDASLKHKFDRIKASYRTRLQYGFDDFQSINFNSTKAITWRNKAEIKYYPFGFPMRPFVASELFNQLNRLEGPSLVGVRYQAGTDILITNQLIVDLFFIVNQELNQAKPKRENILGASLAYSF